MTANNWVILGKDHCKYCTMAKDYLQKKGFEFSYHDVTLAPDLKKFMKDCGLTSVPQVYLNGDLIGGYGDLIYVFEGDFDNGQY